MAKADEVTVTYADVFGTSSNITDLTNTTTEVKNGDVQVANIAYVKNSGSNAPAYYTSNKTLRLYRVSKSTAGDGNSVVITPETGVTITGITVAGGASLTASAGSYNNGNWTGSETSAVSFQNRTKSNISITSITITYTKEAEGPKDYTPNFQAEYGYNTKVTEAFAIEGEHPAFNFKSSDETIATIADAENGAFTIATFGKEGTANFEVTWAASEKWNASATPATFAVKVEKRTYAPIFADMILEEGESKAVELGEVHPELIMMEADPATVATVDEETFTVNALAEGTAVVNVMWGDEYYKDGEASFNVTVSKKLVDPELSFDKAEITEYIGSLEQDLPVLTATEGLKITYSSSNEAAATIDAQTGAVELVAAGTTTITATSEATAEYKAGEASYILNVKAAPTGGYALLTNIDDLVDGTVGVIVAQNGKEALGNYDSRKGRFDGATVAFSEDMNNVSWEDNAGVIEFTFNKSGEGYTIGDGEKFISASSSSTDLNYGSTSAVAKISLDDNSYADIVFRTGYMLLYNSLQNTNVFKNYKDTNKGNKGYENVKIYIAQPAAEVVVPNMVVDGEENAEPVIVFHEGMTIHFNIPEGVRVYRRFVATEEPATPAPARVTGEDGNEYERHTEAYTVPGYGTLSYFAESQGVRSAVKEVRVSDTTGVEDITVGGEEGEAVYYDMTGRRVANPTAGLYIRVNGSTATKVYLR